jgi:arylsulfatase A-like enzyme
VNTSALKALDDSPGNRLFFIFYDSSHHDYDWPPDEPAPFTPYAKTWKYNDFSIGQEQLNLVKNRYRNALHFQDRLFGDVVSKLKNTGQYDNAIIVALGDHGEEFNMGSCSMPATFSVLRRTYRSSCAFRLGLVYPGRSTVSCRPPQMWICFRASWIIWGF